MSEEESNWTQDIFSGRRASIRVEDASEPIEEGNETDISWEEKQKRKGQIFAEQIKQMMSSLLDEKLKPRKARKLQRPPEINVDLDATILPDFSRSKEEIAQEISKVLPEALRNQKVVEYLFFKFN